MGVFCSVVSLQLIDLLGLVVGDVLSYIRLANPELHIAYTFLSSIPSSWLFNYSAQKHTHSTELVKYCYTFSAAATALQRLHRDKTAHETGHLEGEVREPSLRQTLSPPISLFAEVKTRRYCMTR